MTDARLAPSILTHPLIDLLSDGAHRVYVNAIVYSVDKGLDGKVPERALRLLHPTATVSTMVDELLLHGLWSRAEGGYLIRNFDRYQTAAEVVERHRELARLRKQKQREKDLEKEEDKLGVTRDGTRDRPRDGRATLPRTGTGTGQDQAVEGEPPVADATPDVWPVTARPGEPHCTACGDRLDPAAAEGGFTTHPRCDDVAVAS